MLLRADGQARERSRREIAAHWPPSGARRRHPPPRSASFEPAPDPALPPDHLARRLHVRTRTAAASRWPARPRSHELAARSCPAGTARGAPRPQRGRTAGARRSAAAGAARQAAPGGSTARSRHRRRSTRRERQGGQRRDASSSAVGSVAGRCRDAAPAATRRRAARAPEPHGLPGGRGRRSRARRFAGCRPLAATLAMPAGGAARRAARTTVAVAARAARTAGAAPPDDIRRPTTQRDERLQPVAQRAETASGAASGHAGDAGNAGVSTARRDAARRQPSRGWA